MRGLLVVLVATGCIESSLVECENGIACPVSTVCDEAHRLCVVPDQLTACAGLAAGAECPFSGRSGTCVDGVCLEARCGDGVRTGAEDCDGTTSDRCIDHGFSQDGAVACHADCTFDLAACTGICGDDVLDDGEQCDGAALDKTDCTQVGYYDASPLSCNALCRYDTSTCTGFCGDHAVNGDEVCEDAAPANETCIDYGYDAGTLGCSSFCSPGFADCDRIGWRQISPIGDGNAILQLWASPMGDVYAAGYIGSTGTIHRLVDDRWEPVPIPATERLSQIQGSADNDIWAWGLTTIVHFDGVAWTAPALPIGAIKAIWSFGPTDVWLASYSSMWHFDGTSWSQQVSGIYVDAMYGTSPTDIWGAGQGRAYHFDGTTWSPGIYLPILDTARVYSVWVVSPIDIFIGTESTTLHFDGVTWQPLYYGSTYRARRVGRAIVAATVGGVLVDNGAGLIYPQLDRFNTVIVRDLLVVGDRIIVAAGATAYESRDTSWTQKMNTAITSTTTLWGPSGDDLYTGNFFDDDYLSHWNGRDWTSLGLPTSLQGPLIGIWGAGRDVFVGGLWSIGHFDGVAWTTQTFTPTLGGDVYVGRIWGTSPTDVHASLGPIFMHYDGTTWTEITRTANVWIEGIWGSAPNDVWAVGGTDVHHFDGATWTPVAHPTSSLTAVWGSAATDVYATSREGEILHFDGVTWTVHHRTIGARYTAIWGYGPDDIFVGAQNMHPLLHFDGTDWNPVNPDIAAGVHAIGGSPARTVILADNDARSQLLWRMRPWRCAATEVACGDSMDNDCDGKFDEQDTDCMHATTIALSEIQADAIDYVEIVNRGARAANLDGITIVHGADCAGTPTTQTFTFPSDAIVYPNKAYRAVANPTLLERERYVPDDLCDARAASGWYALCAGRCDLNTCSNVLDFVAKSGSGAPPPTPACAATAPVDVSSVIAGNSIQRIGFAGTAVDWMIAPTTRD